MVEEVEREGKTQQQSDVSITNETPKQSLKKVVNWLSPALDFALEVRLKNFASLHLPYEHQLHSCFDKGSVPECMTKNCLDKARPEERCSSGELLPNYMSSCLIYVETVYRNNIRNTL